MADPWVELRDRIRTTVRAAAKAGTCTIIKEQSPYIYDLFVPLDNTGLWADFKDSLNFGPVRCYSTGYDLVKKGGVTGFKIRIECKVG